jgi:MFS family permease
MRGRVMSLYGLVLLGSTPPSGLLSGWMAGQFGPRSILLLSGVSCVTAAGVAALAGRGRPAESPATPGDAEQAA